jgi:hypothetical protein
MDAQTFQRFTFWHSRITQSARGPARGSTGILRRPEWRTLSEMLRVCELTAVDAEPHTGRRGSGAAGDGVSLLSIGAGVGERRLARERWTSARSRFGRLLARLTSAL